MKTGLSSDDTNDHKSIGSQYSIRRAGDVLWVFQSFVSSCELLRLYLAYSPHL